MNNRNIAILFGIIVFILSCFVYVSCSKKPLTGRIIVTQVSGKLNDADYHSGSNWRYITRARIVAFDRQHPSNAGTILTRDFFSALSPEISFDGKYMLFTAQQKENDPWQIWEMEIARQKARKVISCAENCTDPAYLPGGRLVFSRQTVNDTLKSGHSLFTCDLDGSGLKRITFSPNTYFASTILKDGRILTIDKKQDPDKGSQALEVLRPDGTKAELFYPGIKGCILKSGGWETADGKIIFIESAQRDAKGDIISISYNRPLHSRVNLTAGFSGDFRSVSPLPSGMFLVSWRPSGADRYAIFEFDPDKKSLSEPLFIDNEYDAMELVVVQPHVRPKKLPSEVDMGVKTGLLLCQDINIPDLHPGNTSVPKASRIEVLGMDSTMGIVQVEEDGSFYLKVMADKPFRIQTLDNAGHVLQGPGDWIWLRPNERRGCVGCHEDHERVPENRIPLAVKKLPVSLPVHISKVVEKKISLE